jgi:hypothetical protein
VGSIRESFAAGYVVNMFRGIDKNKPSKIKPNCESPLNKCKGRIPSSQHRVVLYRAIVINSDNKH